MYNLIGEKVEIAKKKLEDMGYNCSIVDNNFNIAGDTKLVTNIVANDKTVKLITGDFIFDVRNKKNEK